MSLIRYATPGERRAAIRLVSMCLANGNAISVNDGEEWTVLRSTSLLTVLRAMATTGEDTLMVRGPERERIATFILIWGNAEDGTELVSDYGGPAADAIWQAWYAAVEAAPL